MITHNTSLEHNAGALRHSPVRPESKGTPLSANDRRSIAALALATAIFGGIHAAPAVGELINSHNQPKYTTEQLHDMPQEQVVVREGDTPDSITRQVDPELAQDPQARAEVENYVQMEGLDPNHQLHVNQQVLVPLTHEQNR